MEYSVKVSIIVPVYNASKYLRECLDSLINQTLKEIEIICINDGSTDNSWEILQEYADKDDRIVLINQENQSQAAAQNKGLEIFKGETVAFCDSDDTRELNAYEIMYKNLKKYNVDQVACNIRIYDYTGKDLHVTEQIRYPAFEKVFYTKKEIRLHHSEYIWRRLFDAKFFREHKIRCRTANSYYDISFSKEISIYADSFLFINDVLCNYRVISGSQSHGKSHNTFNVFQVYDDFQPIYEKTLPLIEDEYKEGWKKRYEDEKFDFIFVHFKRTFFKDKYKYIKKAKSYLTPKLYRKFVKKALIYTVKELLGLVKL